MVRPKRKDQHSDLQTIIKQVARKQMSEQGAVALSLRAIAREIGITAPAIYNYFPRRDDLVTALIVDAYNSFATALVAGMLSEKGKHSENFLSTARAYRQWALRYPEQYNLIFGTPIPGYEAPMQITGPAAAKSMMALVQVLDAADQDDELTLAQLPDTFDSIIHLWKERLGYTGSSFVIYLALACWAKIHGLVSLELYGHLPVPSGRHTPNALFESEIQAMLTRLGLK